MTDTTPPPFPEVEGEGDTPGAPEWAARFVPGGPFVLDAPDLPPAIWGKDEEVAWAEGEALMICGPAGVGKTTLTVQVVAARMGIVCESVLGMPVRPGEKKALYLAMDRPPQISRAMARLFKEKHREAINERLAVWKGPPPRDFAKYPTTLLEMCQQADADTVIVDSIKDAVRKPSDDESGGGYNTARQLALREGVQVIELHHQRKAGGDNKKPSKLDDVYGSTWLTAGAGSVILLWGEAGDPVVELLHLKQPAETLGPWQVRHDHTAGLSEIVHQVDILQMVRHQGTVGLTAKLLATSMFTEPNPSAAQIEKARRRLDRLVDNEMLVRRSGSGGGAKGGTPSAYFLRQLDVA